MDGVLSYSGNVNLFNGEQNSLKKARIMASLTALFLESGAVAASKLGLRPNIRIASAISMIVLPPLVNWCFRVPESETILYQENQIVEDHQIPLTAQDFDRKKDKKELGTYRFVCVVLSVILVAGTLFVFRAKESIKMTALALSSLALAISYVKCFYIHLDNTSPPTPPKFSKQEETANARLPTPASNRKKPEEDDMNSSFYSFAGGEREQFHTAVLGSVNNDDSGKHNNNEDI